VLAGVAGLVILSLIVVVWAKTRPGFDPYGWLVWGHQTLLGSLDTNAAPSWKPLSYLFTVPYAIFGHYELWLWMVTCVAISLGGALAAGHIVYRLTRQATAPGHRSVRQGSVCQRRERCRRAAAKARQAATRVRGGRRSARRSAPVAHSDATPRPASVLGGATA
jgi:hypothetical protein